MPIIGPGLLIFIILFSTLRIRVCAFSEAAEADRVTDLPGLNISDLSHFAGFVNISSTGEIRQDIFYWFVESQSASREADPLVIWTNGGPGCSGLIGLLSEMGPFRPVDAVTLDPFPYAWTEAANVIFVEQPLFTGFSISSRIADSVTDDEVNAAAFVRFILRWLDKFPEFAARELYLASESYGGHYLPVTARHLLEHNARLATKDRAEARGAAKSDLFGQRMINFRGFLVGNPYTNAAEGNKGLMSAIWGHGLLPTPAYEQWARRCDGGDDATGDCGWLPWSYWSAQRWRGVIAGKGSGGRGLIKEVTKEWRLEVEVMS